MTEFFQGFFRMAFGASVVALVILAVRPILKKYSNRIACLLWAVLLFRLLCPYVIESPAPAFFERWEQQMEASQTGGDAGFDVEGSPKHVTPLDELAKAPKQAQDPWDIARIDDQTTVSESTWDVAGKPSASEEGLTKTEETKAGAEDLTKIEGKTEVEKGLAKTEGKTEAGQAETRVDPGYETDETKAQASKGLDETKGGQEQDVAQDSQTEDLGKLWQQENLLADETTEKLQDDGTTAEKLQADGRKTDGMLADEGQMGELQTGEASLKADAQTEEDTLQAGTQASLVDRIGMGLSRSKRLSALGLQAFRAGA